MTTEADLPDDEMARTLTEALRAGPGTTPWRQAVELVGATPGSDEATALLAARERLEGGKAYREVRPGPGFTRGVMGKIDADVAGRSSKVRAPYLALLAAGLVVGAVMLGVIKLLTGGLGGGDGAMADVPLTTPLATARFDAALPAGWKKFGPLPVDPTDGLAAGVAPAGAAYSGGGVWWEKGLPPDATFGVEATFQFKRIDDDLQPQLFVTDRPEFGGASAVTPHELAWVVQEKGQAGVATPDGQMATASAKIPDDSVQTVRIVVGPTDAAVVVNGKPFWSGKSQLAGRDRYVGVRLVRHGTTRRGAVVVPSVKVMGK